MDADYFRLIFDYTWWARDQLFIAAGGLSDEEWRRDIAFTYGSIAGILRHTQQAEALMSSRFMGAPATGGAASQAAEMPSRDELLALWREDEAKLRPWLAALTDADLQGTVATRTGRMVLWKSMAHMSYHSMQHRSEAAEALTMAGKSPGNIDLIIYLARHP